MTRWFEPPPAEVHVGDPEIVFRALTPDALEADYAAVMRDVDMLRRWSAQDWPTATFTPEENLADLVWHDQEQRDGIALTYSVIVRDRILGCIYARPFLDALRTREVPPPATTSIPTRDTVVRGWAHEIPPRALIAAALEAVALATGGTRCWWMTNLACTDQVAACDSLGLQSAFTFVGPTATWVVRGMTE